MAQTFAKPTKAHAVTKRLMRAFLDHGVRAADELLLDLGPRSSTARTSRPAYKQAVEHGSKTFRGKAAFRGA